jgi:hypothetical protein
LKVGWYLHKPFLFAMELDVFTAARAASMGPSRGYERKQDNQMIVKRLALPTLTKHASA